MSSFPDRKEKVRSILVGLARQRKTIFYKELGQLVGIPAAGPWKPLLDAIAREEHQAGRPDITYLVITRKSGLPGQIEYATASRATAEQRQIVEKTTKAVFDFYSNKG